VTSAPHDPVSRKLRPNPVTVLPRSAISCIPGFPLSCAVTHHRRQRVHCSQDPALVLCLLQISATGGEDGLLCQIPSSTLEPPRLPQLKGRVSRHYSVGERQAKSDSGVCAKLFMCLDFSRCKCKSYSIQGMFVVLVKPEAQTA